MKKHILFIAMTIFLAFAWSCQQDDELRVVWDESYPVFDSIYVVEDDITYGDSITLHLGVSDNKTPLSTLEIKVVVNDEILASEIIRTKGNSASYSMKYSIPFVARMPDNADVEVHVKSINVEGYATDTILVSTKAHRVAIPNLYMTFNFAAGIKLNLVDPDKHIYMAENLTLANSLTFRLATKVRSGNRIDWTGMAFGMPDGQFGIIDSADDPQFTLVDPTIYGFNKITVDLLNFTITGEGRKLEPATLLDLSAFAPVQLSSTNHLNETVLRNWQKLETYVGKNVEIEFSGFGDISQKLTPDFFEVTAGNKAKFLGETGIYIFYYLPEANFMYVEQPNAKYPDVLWLDGVGAGRPVAPFKKTTSWNWNSPEEYVFCRKVTDGIYQATIYAEHLIDEAAEEPWRHTFSMKFFHQRGWGGEEDARTYTLSTDLLFAPTAADLGNFVGTANFNGNAGVYRFTINTTAKSMSFVKLN